MSSARELRRPGGRSSTKLQKIFAGTALTVSLKLSVVCLGCGIYVAARGSSTDCITFLQWGFIAVALVLLFNFIIVVKFYYRHKETTSSLYLLIMLLALLTLLSLMIAAFVHINIKPVNDGPRLRNINDLKALDKPQPVREYSLGDYRGQLKRQVGESRFWARISGCLLRRHPCNGMSPLFLDPNSGVLLANRTSNKFPDDPGLSPIESGCCKPPLSCGFTYVNQTTWTVPAGAPTNNTDDDCSRWSNDQGKLCFQCDSCKAGVLADIQRAWATPVILMTFFTLLHIILYPCICVDLCYDFLLDDDT
ncbi:hypothetical protein QOZ80_4BG0330520 [Eleusine coracana subsp. coracana]|nr:hypothetical protein QOZ80_4BG0330520 [Eleusine coracana subsp. coracana]